MFQNRKDRAMEKKVCVITGASGVLCSAFAIELAKNGMAVALLNRTPETGKALEERIKEAGGTAKSYAVSVLDKAALEEVHQRILSDLGPCSVLINGAGGNDPRATTTNETYKTGDELRDDISTFFNLSRRL